jgi:hypothetical protein
VRSEAAPFVLLYNFKVRRCGDLFAVFPIVWTLLARRAGHWLKRTVRSVRAGFLGPLVLV